MARMILTLVGPWTQAPAWEGPFTLTHSEPDREAARQIVEVGLRAGVLEDTDIAAIRRHAGVLEAEAVFQKPGDRSVAAAAVRLLQRAFAEGASGALCDTSLRAFTQDALADVEPDDAATLLHLFVEVLGDGAEWTTEGMQCFDLPDIVVPHAQRELSGAAQVAAFSLAARMVCDRFRPTEGAVVRASESAPFFTCTLRPAAPDTQDDPFVNPRGAWVLTPR